MHTEVDTLLALQSDDIQIRELESRLAELEPRVAELDRKRQATEQALDRARGAVEAEERRQRELQEKAAQHKQVQEKNLAQLDLVKRVKEATAAMAQVEAARRIIADDESELAAIARRLVDLRAAVTAHQAALAGLEEEQTQARETIDAERREIDAELDAARAERQAKTSGVPRTLLGKYDRIRTRRVQALYPLRGDSCGHCDTAIPMQRRNLMGASGGIEVCEACGVLLYRAASA